MKMNQKMAYDIASQWGSYMKAGDPGSCFYAFHSGDGRPVSEDHRRNCLDYLDRHLIPAASVANTRELGMLRDFFLTAPLYEET